MGRSPRIVTSSGGLAAVSVHPTGMHSCFQHFNLLFDSVSKVNSAHSKIINHYQIYRHIAKELTYSNQNSSLLERVK